MDAETSELALLDQDLFETLWEALKPLDPEDRFAWLQERFPDWSSQLDAFHARPRASREIDVSRDEDLYAIVAALSLDTESGVPMGSALVKEVDYLTAWLELHGIGDGVVSLFDDIADGLLPAVRSSDFVRPPCRPPFVRNVVPADRIADLRDALRNAGDGDRVSRSSSIELPPHERQSLVSGLSADGYDDARLGTLWDETRALLLVVLERALTRSMSVAEIVHGP
ncbi:MAG: hypothetical protein IT379_38945 [Deltaproteobacteria bacterium]|nr:hypothetical protein [Deltaproteobacteria bacterium]